MTGLQDDVSELYASCGSRHILPFIGDAFLESRRTDFRVVVIGFNAYVSDGDWPEPIHRVQPWFRRWWAGAGCGPKADTHRFYNDAFSETTELAASVAAGGAWRGLTCDLSPDTKRSLFATNALKVYTTDTYKRSPSIPEARLAEADAIWRRELDLMARSNVLPHLIVVFGRALWESHWRSLHPKFCGQASFAVESYIPAGLPTSRTYHHANRVTLRSNGREHPMLLACLHHPGARAAAGRRRNAAWLLAQPEFRNLLDLPLADAG